MTEQKALFFDIETHSVDDRWSMSPEEFFRLGGYAWGREGAVHLTEDLEEMLAVIREADLVVGHNVHNFDLSVLFGKDSTEPLEMALDNRVWDTIVHAALVHQAPASYLNRAGVRKFVRNPGDALGWLSLDNQAYQLGVAGKAADLKALAAKHGGFGAIPTTDREYREYLVQDVVATRDVAKRLLQLGGNREYIERENINAAIDAQNTRNGWRVNVEAANKRIAEQDEAREHYLAFLAENYGFPTTGAAPLRTTAGKEALAKALADVGVSLDDLPRTKDKTGKETNRPSFAGDGLIKAAKGKGEDAENLAEAVAQIGGMRPLAQQALGYMQPDGKVHPEITALQRSGRKSTTKPGLTTWGSRDGREIDKAYFIPNQDDHVIVEFDYSQADARIVAAYSGDEEFAKRFAPGADAHLITAYLVWGEDVVGHEFDEKGRPIGRTAHYRQMAKGQNHAYSYNAGPQTLARNAGVELDVSKLFVAQMRKGYPKVEKWKTRVIKEGSRGSVTNSWGRKMIVDAGKEFTQAPALYGQSGTREIVVDGLIRLARRDIRTITFLLAQVHDALVFSVPAAEVDHWVPLIKECMETTWQPFDGSGMAVHFPVDGGVAGHNWMSAGH